MDYRKFLARLPNLYENWVQDSVRPKSSRFQPGNPDILNNLEIALNIQKIGEKEMGD